MLKLCTVLLGCFSMASVACELSASVQESVVLLHGLGRTRHSMKPLEHSLKREGYRVINVSYASRSRTLESLATEWLPAQIGALGDTQRVHFVTHSMGGILVRLWLRECGIPSNLGRVVMLAPPNSGSEITERWANFPPFRWFTGRNGVRLGTAAEDLPRALGAWPPGAGELGVIAGTCSLNPILAARLPQPHDGKVSVAATHLEGEHDHLVLPYSHTWLGYRARTAAHVIAFLRSGRFGQSAP